MPSRRRLLEILDQAKSLAMRPKNDFSWSGWSDAEEATAEIQAMIDAVGEGQIPSWLQILFAPTGPLQELSLSSGWGNEFVSLASEFDVALKQATCSCQTIALELSEISEFLGTDESNAEIEVLACPVCGERWLRYFWVNEAVTQSGRWYLGDIGAMTVQPENARETLENLPWFFQGGSWFGGQITKSSGPIRLL